MGLKDRAKKLVSDQLRPWLRRDVSPILNVSVSEISMVLPHLEFDAEVLNQAGMESSPLVIMKESSMKVESVQLTFAPFREPVLAVLVQGWHLDLEPRSAEDVWWEKKKEKAAEQEQIAALVALDPQGASEHTAAEGLADEKGGNSLTVQFLTSLMLTSVRLEFRNCSIRLVSRVHSGRQHVFTIPLSSFEFGGGDDCEGFSWSGGFMGAVTAALGGMWKKNGAPIEKYCSIKGLGLLVETHGIEGDGHGSRKEDNQQEHVNAEVEEHAPQNSSGHSSLEDDGTTISSAPAISAERVDSYVVLFEDLVLGIRFIELAMDAMEFDAREFAIGLELQEVNALQIVASQIQGLAQDSPTRGQEGVSDSGDAVFSRRNPKDLWKRGIQKAIKLSSRGRLTYTFKTGILRSRYSSLYESWLLELGWGRRQGSGAGKAQSKKRADRLMKLSEEISEIEKKLSIEAIALGRRVARHRVSAARNSNENTIRTTNSLYQSERLGRAYSSFQAFMVSFWRIIAMSTILMQGKALGASMWTSATRIFSVSEWKLVSKTFWRSEKNEKTDFLDDSQSVPGSEASSVSNDESTCPDYTAECGTPENYFQLGRLEGDDGTAVLPIEKKRRWGMVYAFKIRRGSITLAGRAIKALHKGKEPDSKEGALQLESALIPAVHLSWKEMVLAYGYTGSNSGTSISCGSLGLELFSIIPSQLSQRLSANLDAEVFHKEFSSLGRWTCKKDDRAILLSSSPFPQRKNTGAETNSGHPLAGEVDGKYWTWQERHLRSWSRSWPKPSFAPGVNGGQSTASLLDGYDRPFFIAEFRDLEDDPCANAYPGGIIEFSLALGQLDLFLKGSSFTCVCYLVNQFMMSEKPTEKKHTHTRIQPQSQYEPSVSLEKIWDDNYSKYLNMCRDAMVAAIPKRSTFFSAVVECPRVRLSATAAELHEYGHDSNTATSWDILKLDLNTEAAVTFDFGRFELAVWPPQKKKEAVVENPSEGVRSDRRAPKDLWNHAVESKLWLNKPPGSAHREFSERGHWDYEQVGSNMYICIEELALTLELDQKELPVFGPLAFIIETSVCWDQYSSLLRTNKSVSAAVSGKLLPLSVEAYLLEVTIVQQVVCFYMEVMKSRLGGDPVMVVEGGETFLTVEGKIQEEGETFLTVEANIQEEATLLSEESRDFDADLGSFSSEEVAFAACTLTFAVKLENFRLVLGESRQEGGYLSSGKSVPGVQSKMRQSGRLKGERRGKRLQAVTADFGDYDDDDADDDDDAHDWEQDPSGLVLGREVYVLIQDTSFGASLGDEENICVFMELKNTFLRLVKSGSESSRSDLAKMRNDFFCAWMKSFPRLVLAEVALEHFSVKVLGAGPHQCTVVENDSRLETLDFTDRLAAMQQEESDTVDGPQLSSPRSETNLFDLVQSSYVDPTNMTVKVHSQSAAQLTFEDQGSPERQNPIQLNEASSSNPLKGETLCLAVEVEVSKVLVTDGSVDVLVAKVLLVADGEENLHVDFGVGRGFQNISLGVQGGLVLVHTAAVATWLKFYADLGDAVARTTILSSNTAESPEETPSYQESKYNKQVHTLSSVDRSASAPALSTEKFVKNMTRTFSAPALAEVPVAEKSELVPLPRFEGLVFSKLAGFSLVLAKQSGIDSEGVLFGLEMSTMLEVGDSATKATFDLTRFTILGLPARGPENSRRKTLSRSSSHTPQFGASFKVASADVQSLSSEPLPQAACSLGDASETYTVGELKDQLKEVSSDHTVPDALSSIKEEQVVADGELKGKDGTQQPASVDEQAERFQKSLSDFNSFILERLSVHFAVEKVCDQHKIWKWTNAWHGRCSIDGFDVAITTSEIQLLEALVAPLSGIGGSASSKSTGGESAAGAGSGVGGIKEVTENTNFEIPDGAIIAVKDVYEHCYLAAEEISTNKGQYRLTGVLHYSLAGDKALFKVKYQDPLSASSKKDAWFSLLSLHAKDPHGEPIRVNCSPGSGSADISSSKDGPWEKWKFVPAESSDEENNAEVDIQNATNKHLFHLVNYKSKSGIAFQENVPVIVKQPGNPFKVKIFATAPDLNGELQEDLARTEKADQEVAGLVNSIPSILCSFDTFIFTVLHEAGGGLHLLPLLRLRIPGSEGVVHTGLSKTRTILQCGIVLEHFESQSSRWVSIVNPIETDLFYRARSTRAELTAFNSVIKCPVAFFSRFRKVDVVFSEPSLDAVLFLIGALDLAGPFALRYSPVQANRCLVKNQTGVDALCRFDQASSKVGGMIPSSHSDSFLMRHMTSRRDSGRAKVASSIALYLQKPGKGATSPVIVSLGDPAVFATKTRLQADTGKMMTGPMVVVDISRRSEDGIRVTVLPMVRIRNASGLPLELRCRRDSGGEESAVVVLGDGDTIDDSMAAFDALNLAGEIRKALSSLNLGNYCLSVRPTPGSSSEGFSDSEGSDKDDNFDWSEDIKGAKPVKTSGVLDKLKYNFTNTAKAHNLKSSFGVVFCRSKLILPKKSSGPDNEGGLHFLVRTTCRQVPVSRPKKGTENEQQQGQYSIVAWQQQQELLLLPTVRLINLTTSNISVLLVSTSEDRKRRNQGRSFRKNVPISSFGTESMYVDLGDLLLTVTQEDLDLTSKPIGIGGGSKEFAKNSKLSSTRDVEMEVDFGDGLHSALVNIRRGADGVLEILLWTRYTLQNDSPVNVLCCSARHSSWWRGMRKQEPDWPSSGTVLTVESKSIASWFERSTTVLVKRTEPLAEAALLDLESVSGSMEISLRVHCPDSVDNKIQLGVQLEVPSAEDSNPSCIILLVPRYVVANDSNEAILVCQDGFQDTNAVISLAPGESSALNGQELPGHNENKGSGNEDVGPDLLLKVRFRPKESVWSWSGPVCAAALGSFSVKIKHLQQEEAKKPQAEDVLFAVIDVQEKKSSLIMAFRRQPDDKIPYRIENALLASAITYNQVGLENSEVLEAGASVGYVWDDLDESHALIVSVAGLGVQDRINPDKLRSWKSFRTSRGKTGLLQIPFLNDLSRLALYGDGNEGDDPPTSKSTQPLIGYEVYADGPTRVVRLCEERHARVERHWQSDVSSPKMEIDMRIPIFTVSIVEPGKQPGESEKEEGESFETLTYVPVICLRLTKVLIEARITREFMFCQMKAERLDVDVKWNGAPVAAMLRGHGQDRFETGHTMLHMAIVMSNLGKNPIQLKYASVLLQAVDLNLDEDTLMKLAPFYRLSLSESTAPSTQIYFERFEIHPIKIVASFLPGNPRADYSSGQETLRALLHSVIKVPTVRGNTVELNGVLLSNALLTFKQLALKCAQHYSWYAMRGIYIARGSKLLPPGFASLFDDSAASSLDVFFDPSSGSVDLQGLTLGMFGMLKRGLRKKGKGGGTQRYLGDLQHTMKAAGSNILFAAVTEVSDSVVKGADANGFDGVLSGFRRGILNVAMKPSVLAGAVGQGGSTRRIKLDRIVGANEAYIEGYLQAMLDALFKQSYVRVKVMDDQVVLKNLPPNTTLMEEMVQCVRDFLIGEGLLAGESSAAALSSLRRLQGEDDRRLGPTVVALCEQLLVIIVVRSLRRQTIRVLRQNNITFIGGDPPPIQDSSKSDQDKNAKEEEQKEQPRQGFLGGINIKNAVFGFAFSSALAYVDGRICRHIPNPLVRRVVSGFLLSFVE